MKKGYRLELSVVEVATLQTILKFAQMENDERQLQAIERGILPEDPWRLWLKNWEEHLGALDTAVRAIEHLR